MSDFLGLLLLAGVALFVWSSWPTSIWVGLAFIVYWMLRKTADRLKKAREAGRRGLLRILAEAAAASLAQSVAWIGLGIFLVAVAQIVLWAGSQVIDRSLVKSIEEHLSWSYQSLEQVFSFRNLLMVMAGLVVIALLAPRLGVIEKFLTVRRWVSKISCVLLGVTSFTFFSASAVARHDGEWREAERYRARLALQQIDEQIRDITAATWIEEEVHHLDASKRQEFVRFFQTARTSRFPVEIVRAAGTELGRVAPRTNAGTIRSAAPDEGIISARERQYVEDWRDVPPEDQPTLAELRSAEERLSRHSTRLQAVRTAAIETAGGALAELVPETDHRLARALVQELVSTVAKSALGELVPTRVADANTAKEWLKGYLAGADAWTFHPSALKTASDTNVRTSEVAVAALVQRLEAEHAARITPRSFPENFGRPGEFWRPGTSVPEFRPVPHEVPHPHIPFRR
jgi:hypothetical protein